MALWEVISLDEVIRAGSPALGGISALVRPDTRVPALSTM